MKKAIWVMILLCLALALPSAHASESLPGAQVYEGGESGIVRSMALSEEGMLLVCTSPDMLGPSLVFAGRDGRERWTYTDERDDAYLSPSALAGGGFSVLRKRISAGGDVSEAALLLLDKNGNSVKEIPLSGNPRSVLIGADGFSALGELPGVIPEENSGSGNARPLFERLSGQGDSLLSCSYPYPGYSSWVFHKGAFAHDSIIVSGAAHTKSPEMDIGILCRISTDGTMLENLECSPDTGSYSYINDFCVTDDGWVVLLRTETLHDEKDGSPIDRMCAVLCVNMKGELLWEHKLEGGAMADYIVPVAGGYLCASRGLDLENCPFIGNGWLLLLDHEGNAKAADSTPNIGGGELELFGMAKDESGVVWLYGTLLDDPGFPGAPFALRLDFPEAYQ